MNNAQTARKAIWFILPALAIYILFAVFPLLMEIIMSLFKWNGVAGSNFDFVGLSNYIEVFRNEITGIAFVNIVKVVAVSLMTQLPLALLFGVLLSKKLRGSGFFKTSFLMPYILSMTAVSLMWTFLLNPNDGILNLILQKVGLGELAIPWLTTPEVAIYVIALVNSWVCIGYYMIIILAGLTSVPQSTVEAARLDGAHGTQMLFRVVLPQIKGVLSTVIMLILINSLKIFDVIYVMTSGSFGPYNATQVPMTLMYRESFVAHNFGAGSAIGTVVFVIGIALSIALQRMKKRNDD